MLNKAWTFANDYKWQIIGTVIVIIIIVLIVRYNRPHGRFTNQRTGEEFYTESGKYYKITYDKGTRSVEEITQLYYQNEKAQQKV